MSRNSFILFFVPLLFCVQIACAQNMVHYNLWSRLRVSKTFNPKWETEIDLQYRRQDDDNVNIFSLPLAYSTRLWVYYRPQPRFTIGFSPFTWFHNNQLVSKPTDKLKEWNEYRVFLYGEYRISVARKLMLLSRIGAEPTFQVRAWGNRNFVRWRWREQMNLQVKPATQLFIGGELFINSISSEKMDFYNQSRGYAGILYHTSANFEVTASYMFQHIDAIAATGYQKCHNLVIGAQLHL